MAVAKTTGLIGPRSPANVPKVPPTSITRPLDTEPPPKAPTNPSTVNPGAPAKVGAPDIWGAYGVDNDWGYKIGSDGQLTPARVVAPPWSEVFPIGDDGIPSEPVGYRDNPVEADDYQNSLADGPKGIAWANRKDATPKTAGGNRFSVPREIRPQDRQSIHQLAYYLQGPGRDAIQDTLDAINLFHDVGPMPELPIRGVTKDSLGGQLGSYYSDPNSPRMEVAHDGLWPRITTAHEIGHFLDEHGWWHAPSEETASVSSQKFADWRDAVENTDAVKKLRAMKGQNEIEVPDGNGGAVRMPIDQGLVDYYLKPWEIFARSYAQYIATKAARAGHASIGEELSRMMEHYKTHEYSAQWSPDDFEPVMSAFESLLKNRGILK